MTVNLGLRRIASLSAFLVVVGITSASHAGIIPWAYDVIFGPVRYQAYGNGYSPYVVSYSRPVYVNSAPMYGYPSGCSSCSTRYYAPVSYASPSYGCGSVVMAPSCGPCGAAQPYGTANYAPVGGCLSGCAPSPTSAPAPATNGKSAWNSTKKPGEPSKAPAPTPRTFQDPDRGAAPASATSKDGLDTGTRLRGTRAAEAAGNAVDVNRPATTNDEPIFSKPTKVPTKTVDEVDSQPEPSPAKPSDKKIEQPVEKDAPASDAKNGTTEQTIRLPLPKLNLDAKIAWQAEPQRTRVPFHAKLVKASVTRRVPGLDSDWTPVVAKPTATQLVRK